MKLINCFSSLAGRTIRFGLVALIAVAANLSSVAADATITTPLTLRNHVTVSGGSVHLGDIFDGFEVPRAGVSGETIVAYAPQPGRRAIFDAKWLSRVAQRYRLDWRPTTRLDRVLVERSSTVINAEDIAAALRKEIAARGNAENIELELSNRNLLVHIDSDLPATVEVVHIATEPRRGQFSAIISVPAGEPNARRITVAGQMYSVVEVPVLNRRIRRGEVIASGDVIWKNIRKANVGRNVVRERKGAIGQAARRYLAAGTQIMIDDLEAPKIVRKGSLVTIYLETANLRLTAKARASEDGAMNDTIRVVNVRSKKTVEAVVRSPSKVAIPVEFSATH